MDAVRLDVTSKATLAGLDQSLTKLKALQAALDNIHERLAGLSTGPGLKRTKAEIEELLKAGSKVRTMPVSEVAKTLDIDLEKFRKHVAEWKRLNKEKAKTALTREGTRAGMNEQAFTSASQAAKVANAYYTKAEKARKEGEKRMVKLFMEAPDRREMLRLAYHQPRAGLLA